MKQNTLEEIGRNMRSERRNKEMAENGLCPERDGMA
jgi:hypothetical protein